MRKRQRQRNTDEPFFRALAGLLLGDVDMLALAVIEAPLPDVRTTLQGVKREFHRALNRGARAGEDGLISLEAEPLSDDLLLVTRQDLRRDIFWHASF